jgi:Lrp/AsnC family transcriptional regulator, regulator for asnA, asnC and gidA
MPVKTGFDPLDYQIVQELHANVRASAAEIARKVGANERTVRNRIERLIADNVIRPTAVINPEAFGYITATDIFLEAEPELEDEIIQALRSIPEVTYIAFGQGSRDISIEARFKNNDDMRQFMRRTLPNIAGVLVKGYALVPRILRNIDEWTPKKEDFGLTAD